MNYKIYPPEEMIETSVNLPLSKSMSNRGAHHQRPHSRSRTAHPSGRLRRHRRREASARRGLTGEINVGAAGTAMRFLTALAACTPGHTVVIDGTDRMRQRPIAPLVDALRLARAPT